MYRSLNLVNVSVDRVDEEDEILRYAGLKLMHTEGILRCNSCLVRGAGEDVGCAALKVKRTQVRMRSKPLP
jgi:hypothetical protein